MDEAHRRQRTRKARRSGAESKSSEPEEQQVLISASVAKFIDGLQENVQNAASDRIKALGNPANIRGSTKIRGRPRNDPMFRIETGNYRVFYKRIGGKVHVVEMEHRQGAYGKGKQRGRRKSRSR